MRPALYNQGAQTRYFAPVDELGRPSVVTTPTYSIVDLRRSGDDSNRTIVASTSATIGSATTTTSAIAGPSQADPTRMTVAAVTSFVAGRRYLITLADGRREDFYLARIDDGVTFKYLYAAAPLSQDYTSGATVRAFELEASFPSGEANDEQEVKDGGGPYQITWVYTLQGLKYVVPQIVWLTRYLSEPWVTPADLAAAWPTLPGRLRDVARPESAIVLATDDWLTDCSLSGIEVAYYRPSELARVAVRTKALEYCLRWVEGDDRDAREIERCASRYQYLLDNQVRGQAPKHTVQLSPSDDVMVKRDEQIYGNDLIRRS